MKILITSDSHGLVHELDELIKTHQDVEFYIHCGDSELPSDHPSISEFITVKGNCDFGSDYPNERLIETKMGKIFVTHGHLYDVKYGLNKLKYKAMEMGANIVCFGHSHIVGMEEESSILFLNPGSLRLPRMRKERTYLILEWTDLEKIVHTYEYGKGKLFQKHFPNK
ncbi:metallophosphoesterase family protein [Fervidibacillus halotolerans]|uniref:Phosphoesterase n=1 Tax=Fervidibacillus halotolerans TaxID=2980027 RepID=A0A9E8LXL4_9BACI|nr:metallophosphoesterase [Fervidibacillus halotolerans]WAA11608.1 metallophosphoesterase [Fervidibacillus halotolerans]